MTLPITLWDGDTRNKNPENLTIINLIELGNLVEILCANLISFFKEGSLEIVLNGGHEEVGLRYWFTIKK